MDILIWAGVISFGLFVLVVGELILFGSPVDPDDNGIIGSEETKYWRKIKKLRKMHKRYPYIFNPIDYLNSKLEVTYYHVFCNKCFWQGSSYHLTEMGDAIYCPYCSNENLNTEAGIPLSDTRSRGTTQYFAKIIINNIPYGHQQIAGSTISDLLRNGCTIHLPLDDYHPNALDTDVTDRFKIYYRVN